jgi:prevent-host-death family protein
MLAKIMDIQDAQARFFDLMALVASGTEVILTKNTKPCVRLVPMTESLVTSVAELPTAPIPIDVEERDLWLFLTQTGLNGAYCADEPEYTLSMIKEPNPVYAGR